MKRIPDWVWMLGMLLGLMAYSIVSAWIKFDDPHVLIKPVDPDTWLRLRLVRDWLEGASWYDHSVVATNAPFGGVTSPWTRPLDVVIAALVKLQFLSDSDLSRKLMRAALFLPIIWAVLAVGGMIRALRKLSDQRAAGIFMVAFIGTMPPVWNFFGTGNADHHAPLCALFVWVASCMLRPGPRDGWLAGALLGFMVWLSPEALMLAGGMYVWSGLRYVVRGDGVRFLWQMTVGAALMTVFAVLVERPMSQWFTPIYDSVSVVQVAQLITCAVAATLIMRLPSGLMATMRGRLTWGGAVAFAMLGLLWLIYPLSFKGPYADVDPFILERFLPGVEEAISPLSEHWLFTLGVLFHPVLAVIGCVLCFRRGGPVRSEEVWTLLMLVCVTLGLYLMQQRWYYYTYPMVVLALTPWLSALYEPEHPAARGRLPALWVESLSEAKRGMVRTIVLFTLLATPLLMFLMMPSPQDPEAKKARKCEKQALMAVEHGALVRALGDKPLILFVPNNVGAHLQFFTPYRIIASNYHREPKGLEFIWDVYRLKDEKALREALLSRQVDALLLCPNVVEVEGNALTRIWEKQLNPRWLKEIPLEGLPKSRYPVRLLKLVP